MDMDADYGYGLNLEFLEHEPLAVYSAVITRDGKLVFPPECLTDVFQIESAPVTAVLTNSLKKGFLSLYPSDKFDEIIEEIRCLNIMNPKVRRLERLIISEAVPLEISKENGMEVDPEQMERLGFDPDKETGPFPVTLLKHENKIEIVPSSVYSSAKGQD